MLELMLGRGELKKMSPNGDQAGKCGARVGSPNRCPIDRHDPRLIDSNRRQGIAQGSAASIRKETGRIRQFQSVGLLRKDWAEVWRET